MNKLLWYLAMSGPMLVGAAVGQAQQYPVKQVRIVVPAGPGTGLDIGARLLSERLAKSMGQSFVVENRAGGATTIGMGVVAAAPPDGYTLLVHGSSLTTLPALMKNLPFSVQRDFAPVAMFADTPLVLVTYSGTGWKSVKDLISAAKARPGSITFASAGVGTIGNLAAEKFRVAAGFQALHVPFKSTTDAMTEVIAGRVHFLFTTTTTALGNIRDGRLVALAPGFQRLPALPNVPTLAESGVPNATTSAWVGLFAPGKTPRDIILQLHRETIAVMSTAEARERSAQVGVDPYLPSLDEVETIVKNEFVENEKLIAALGIKLE